MRSKVNRGFTLVEVSVACVIALILSASLGRLFYESLRWQARALRQTSLRQQLKVAMQRIPADLQQSAPGGIAVGPDRVSIHKLADISTDLPARLLWETELGVYFVDSGGLHRRSWPPAPPDLGVTLSGSSPFQPDSGQLAQLCASGHVMLLGRNVTQLEVTSPQTLPLRITVTVQELNERFSSTRTISLRNAE